MGRKTKEAGDDANLLSLFLKLRIMYTLVNFLLS